MVILKQSKKKVEFYIFFYIATRNSIILTLIHDLYEVFARSQVDESIEQQTFDHADVLLGEYSFILFKKK